MELDRTDFDILRAFQNDARVSNKELASRLSLAPSTCFERVRRLREEGILGEAHAEVDPEAMGIELQAIVSVRMQPQSRDIVDAFHDHMRSRREVLAVYHLAGANDFLVHVAVRDVEHLRSLALDEITNRQGVRHVETSLIFHHERRSVLPNYLED